MHPRQTLAALALALLALLAGCASPVGAPDGSRVSLRERLLSGETFELASGDARLTFTAAVDIGVTHRRLEMDLPLESGTVVVRTGAGGRILFEALDLSLGDLTISAAALPPSGLLLSDVRFTLADAVIEEAQWSEDGDRATAHLQGDVLVDWSFVRGGEEHLPLAQQVLRGVQISVTLKRGPDGRPTIRLDGAAPGTFLRWQDFVRLDDLSMSLEGVPAPR